VVDRAVRPSPLALVVLALLAEIPMHPYRMQQLIKERGKDTVVNVTARNSLHQVIDRLQRAGLVEIYTREQASNRPTRTVYQITDLGRSTGHAWERAMLATPAAEFPEFPAALACIPIFLFPGEVRDALAQRAETLQTELARRERAAAQAAALPRLLLLEDEYKRAILSSELVWVRTLVTDLDTSTVQWDQNWVNCQIERASHPATPPRSSRQHHPR
jgi:DNA-binding PadR family transcriptional regulator